MELQWPLILFTLFVCLSAGTFGVQSVLSLKGKGTEFQMTSLITSLGALVVGGIAVFLHLQHWERIFNGFGHITSGITQELIGIILLVVAMVLFYLFARRSETGQVPQWVAWISIAVSVLLVVVMGHSYNMEGRPSWNTPLLEGYYLANAALLGSLTIMVIAALKKDQDAVQLSMHIAFGGVAAQVIIIVLYAVVLAMSAGSYSQPGMYFDPTLPDVPVVSAELMIQSLFTGQGGLAFWGGTLVIGGIAPLALLMLARKNKERAMTYGTGSLVCALVGSVAWRCVLYVAALSVFAIFLH